MVYFLPCIALEIKYHSVSYFVRMSAFFKTFFFYFYLIYIQLFLFPVKIKTKINNCEYPLKKQTKNNKTICFDKFAKFSNFETEYEGFDGWYNNFAKPDLGAVGKKVRSIFT